MVLDKHQVVFFFYNAFSQCHFHRLLQTTIFSFKHHDNIFFFLNVVCKKPKNFHIWLTWSSILEDCGICLLLWLSCCWTEFEEGVDDAPGALCCLLGLGGASGPCDTPSSLSWAASMSKSYHPHAYTHNPVSHFMIAPFCTSFFFLSFFVFFFV